MTATRCLLTIAGTDPSGGAGIPADLQVFRDWGFHGLSVVSAVVSQNTVEVHRFEPVEPDMLWDQLVAVLADVEPDGIKVGMIPTAAAVERLVDVLSKQREMSAAPLVFDPVMASGSSQSLCEADAIEAMRDGLIPIVDVLTPNVHEAEILLDTDITDAQELRRAAADLRGLGCGAVLLKAGHLPRRGAKLSDVLSSAEGVAALAPLEAIDADVRGTGCQLSSALVAALAQGMPPAEAAEAARSYLNRLLHTRREHIGRGRPVIVRAESSGPASSGQPPETR